MTQDAKLTKIDLDLCIQTLPLEVMALLVRFDLYLAGGFIRAVVQGEKPKDIDLFLSKDTVDSEVMGIGTFLCSHYGYSCFTTDNAMTFSKPGSTPIQVITRWRNHSPEALIKDFDFSISQAVIFCNDQRDFDSLVSEDFYDDCRAKMLRYMSPVREEEAAGSLLRLTKFLKLGYIASDETLAKVMARTMTKVPVSSFLRTKIATRKQAEALVAKELGTLITKVRTRSKSNVNCCY